ncbi:MAG: hypothetical protein JWO44_1098 [Bacteroidetes bacterium]|nr:hypothetical protein [Bacteroidota bacterium]
MKNYKIIENRPELSKEQLKEGMDFNKIKINAGLAKTAFLKILIIKSVFLGVVVVGSGVFIYRVVNQVKPETPPAVYIDSTENRTEPVTLAKSDEKLNNETNTNAEFKAPALAKTAGPALPIKIIPGENNPAGEIKPESKAGNDPGLPDTPVVTPGGVPLSTTSPGRNAGLHATCVIWKTDNYCVVPESAKLINSWDCRDCDFDYIKCNDLDKNLTALWLTVIPGRRQRLKLESEFKNITLIKPDGSIAHPSGVCTGSKIIYGKKFQAKQFIANYQEQIDVFLFFPDAEPGDTIIIKGLIETVIGN